MRVRVLKPMVGVLDGVSLSRLVPGLGYDLEDGLARYLITCGAAEEMAGGRPALVAPIDDPYIAQLTGGITVTQVNPPPKHMAADRPRKVQPSRKRKR